MLSVSVCFVVSHLALVFNYAQFARTALFFYLSFYHSSGKIRGAYFNISAIILGNQKHFIKRKRFTNFPRKFFEDNSVTSFDEILFPAGFYNCKHNMR